MNSSIDNSSGRFIGEIFKLNKVSTIPSPNKAFRDFLMVLRRMLKAVRHTNSRDVLLQLYSGVVRGIRLIIEDTTLGAGWNASGGISNMASTSHSHV